ncbi:MAG: response regulator transcription factor [Bacteroidota bacterium]
MRILICDDEPVLRAGIRKVLDKMEDITDIHETSNANEALSILAKKTFTIAILDISMPGISGLELLKIIKEKWPATYVLMLSVSNSEKHISQAKSQKANGYLTKDVILEELELAIKRIASGRNYFSQKVYEILENNQTNQLSSKPHESLTEKQLEVMIKFSEGKSYKEIGVEMDISPKTVSTHKADVMKKMGFKNDISLLRYCLDNNLILTINTIAVLASQLLLLSDVDLII